MVHFVGKSQLKSVNGRPCLAIPCAVLNKFLRLVRRNRPNSLLPAFCVLLSFSGFLFASAFLVFITCGRHVSWTLTELILKLVQPSTNEPLPPTSLQTSGPTICIFVKSELQPFAFVCPGLLKLSRRSTYFIPSVLLFPWFIIFLLGGARRTKKFSVVACTRVGRVGSILNRQVWREAEKI